MEESGHYYTVYYTSLAVGFQEALAYRHAVLSQMADEVQWLDAAHTHKKEASGPVLNAVVDSLARMDPTVYRAMSTPKKAEDVFDKEYDLNGDLRRIPPEERFKNEYIIHALVDKNSGTSVRSSAFQQKITLELLKRYQADSVEFGLLLHRLGDTFAHSQMGNPDTMYTTTSEGAYERGSLNRESIGHGIDNHLPDYWILRPPLFFEYLKNLYDVLLLKLREIHPASRQRLTYKTLEQNYYAILRRHGNMLGIKNYPFPEKEIQSGVTGFFTGAFNLLNFFLDTRSNAMIKLVISDIRQQMQSLPDVGQIEKYNPEEIHGQTFSQFASSSKIKLSAGEVQTAINNIMNQLRKAEKPMEAFDAQEAAQQAYIRGIANSVDINKLFMQFPR